MSMNLNDKCRALLDWIRSLNKEVKRKMLDWLAKVGIGEKGTTIEKSFQEIFREYEDAFRKKIISLGNALWAYIETSGKRTCDVCGDEIEKGKGAVYLEQDYRLKTEGHALSANENLKELFCAGCWSKKMRGELPKKKKREVPEAKHRDEI